MENEIKLTPGKEVSAIAAHIDMFPTLADIAGVDTPDGQVEGRSLVPLLASPSGAWPDRYLFTHKGRWKTGANPDEFQWKGFAVRSHRFRFVENTMLYDMENDPGQTTNVIDQYPEVVSKMRAAYDEWWKETRPLMVNEDAPMSPTRPFHVLFEQQSKTGIPLWQ